jgi:hypothetical protein
VAEPRSYFHGSPSYMQILLSFSFDCHAQSKHLYSWEGHPYDNFRAVHSAAKLLHARRHSCILLKVDIAKAFDTMAWSLLDMLRHMRFSRHLLIMLN